MPAWSYCGCGPRRLDIRLGLKSTTHAAADVTRAITGEEFDALAITGGLEPIGEPDWGEASSTSPPGASARPRVWCYARLPCRRERASHRVAWSKRCSPFMLDGICP